nr:hypothetical protein HmN_000947700 [Hymenolepis microstoma]
MIGKRCRTSELVYYVGTYVSLGSYLCLIRLRILKLVRFLLLCMVRFLNGGPYSEPGTARGRSGGDCGLGCISYGKLRSISVAANHRSLRLKGGSYYCSGKSSSPWIS